MKKLFTPYFAAIIFVLFPLINYQCTVREASVQNPDELHTEIKDSLTIGVLQHWYPLTIDEEAGGFYSNISHDWNLLEMENQNKMIVTQARHLWTTSKAAEIFPENKIYSKAAAHGFDFLKNKMWDHENGGFFNLVDRWGNPINGSGFDQYKRSYGNAFGIYALAAYYHYSKNPEVLQLAKEAFNWLEKHAHDSINGGYFPSMDITGAAILDEQNQDIFYNIQMFYKDQNTTIHLLEAFAELYHVWPDPLVEERLKELLVILRDTIVAKEGYLHQFLTHDWKPFSMKDSTQKVREANYYLDHVSFGHDIETAFLMLEASHALNKFEWDKTLKIAKRMVDHTVKYGFDPKNSGIYEQGFYLHGDTAVTIVDERKTWWAQAEALNALFLFSKLYPEEKQYETNFYQQWKYIKEYVMDKEHGGWYSYGIDTYPKAKHAMKGHIWKGNYHNGRALMNILKMMEEEELFSDKEKL